MQVLWLPAMDLGFAAADASANEPDDKACQDDSCLCVFGGIELTIEQGIGRGLQRCRRPGRDVAVSDL